MKEEMNSKNQFSFYEPFPEVRLCVVDMGEIRKNFFPQTELTASALPAAMFGQLCSEYGLILPGGFSSFKIFKRQIEHLCGHIAFSVLDAGFLGGGHVLLKKESGEPFVESADFSVSISHAGNFACAAVAPENTRVGVDIERIRCFDNRPSFFRVSFPEKNPDELMSLSDVRIIEMWTMKEAFLKIIGRGFSEKLGAVEIRGNKILYNGILLSLDCAVIDLKDHLLSVISAGRNVTGSFMYE